MDKPVLMRLITLVLYKLRMCMKEDNPVQNMLREIIKGGN